MEKRKLLNTALVGNLVLSCALFVTTLFLLGTPHVGFNAFSTAVIYVFYALAAIVILNKSPSAFSIGLLVGSSFVILVLAFQNALFWVSMTYNRLGLIADKNDPREVASLFASLFHLLIFGVQLGITYVILRSKEDVIDTYAAYNYISGDNVSDRGSILSRSYQTSIPTADI